MSKISRFHEEVEILNSIIRKTDLKETLKWGTQVYTYRGKNVVGVLGFKNFFSLWFYNGVFLKDKHNLLINANKEKTKALRQLRFTSKEEIKEKLILEYINEAIQNEKEGKVWKPQKSSAEEVPDLLLSAFKNNPKLNSAFNNLTTYKQKEYIEYVSSAKWESTRNDRMERIIPMILNGEGLHDRYRHK